MFKSLVPWRHKQEKPSGQLVAGPTRNELMRLREEFDSLLDRFWTKPLSVWEDADLWDVGMGCELEDGEKELVIRAEAPGFEPDEINVRMSGNRLTLEAKHKEERKEGNGHSVHYGQFYRSVTVPHGIETNKIKAEYKHGILEVHLPKGPEAQPKRIAVRAK